MLAPHLLVIYHTGLQLGKVPSTWIEAKIVLIHKASKVPSLPQSYHPISLLNIAYKILASILTMRLNLISDYIHPD